MASYDVLTATRFAALDGLDDWRYLLGAVHATFTAPDYAAALALLVALGEAADAADHHPDLDLRYPGTVHVVLRTHATGSVTTADADLARTISAIAAGAGAVAHPRRAVATELAIDALDIAAVRPFWAAVLGYPDVDGRLADPLGRGPVVWFQQMDAPRPQRNRVHFDITVADDEADARVRAALGAGGRLVDDSFARAFWVLADAEGNEVCVCTWRTGT